MPRRCTHIACGHYAAHMRWTTLLLVCISFALTACGHTVTLTATADDAWTETVGALTLQGLIPASFDASNPKNGERPRVDRSIGEIDLVYAESVYYGQGAAFITVDMDEPATVIPRTVRMWVDYPVGNRVVRYGRSMDAAASAELFHSFERALAKYRAGKPQTSDGKPQTSETASPTSEPVAK